MNRRVWRKCGFYRGEGAVFEIKMVCPDYSMALSDSIISNL